ncbi:uncharacterized protein VTP21DRAFT_1136 [Calcarisporiella thermophila]|uniref:uncharacterized protein n=1 Tax=Calcarisporiella thermophila TaxID=911321 RepID=UPI0037424DF3
MSPHKKLLWGRLSHHTFGKAYKYTLCGQGIKQRNRVLFINQPFSTSMIDAQRYLHEPPTDVEAIGIPATKSHIQTKPLHLEQSRATVQRLLEQNHHEHHIEYNGDRRFSNHAVHTLLTTYALGATPKRLEEIYKHFQSFLDPLPQPKIEINEDNFDKYLGKREHYRDYLDFFDRLIEKEGIKAVFDKYGPGFFPYSIGQAIHPLIHLGFGMEFNNKLVVAEALAFAAFTHFPYATVVVQTFPEHEDQTGSTSSGSTHSGGKSILEILDAIHKDPRIDKIYTHNWNSMRLSSHIQRVLDLGGPVLQEYLQQWEFPADPVNVVNQKLRELLRASALVYASSWTDSPRLDFFLMHVLTSSHAVRVLIPFLSIKDRVKLLRVHFVALVAVYITRKRPAINAQKVLEYISPTLPQGEDEESWGWNRAIELAINHPDEHFPKVIRALKKDAEDFGDEDKLFLRAAEMTCDVVKQSEWGFFED